MNHRKRKYGYSKYGARRLASGIVDLMTVFFITRYRSKPSHFFGLFGLVVFTAGFGIDAYLTVLKILTGTIQGRTPLLLLGILLIIVGIQLLSLGLLGEYMLASSSKARAYSVRERSDT